MELKIIKSKKDYEKAIKVLDSLIDLDPDSGTTEGNRLEVLATIVENYEKEHFPIEKPSPVEAIKIRMEDLGFRQQDLVPFIGSKSKVSEVLSGKRKLTLQMIKGLNKGLHIPAEILLQDNNEIEKEDLQIIWEKFPIKEMVKRGWIATKVHDVKEKAAELIKEFLSPIIEDFPDAVFFRKTLHKRVSRKTDDYALLAWIARVYIRAKDVETMGGYKKNNLTEDFLKDVAKLSWLEEGPLLAKSFLSLKGIIVIFEPNLPKTYLDGASMLDKKKKPIIGLTLRHDRLDNFWFTLLHELAHVVCHLEDSSEVFVDDMDTEKNFVLDEKEIKADQLARNSFIPRSIWVRSSAYRQRTPTAIKELADKLKIHPSIIAGRIRYETQNYLILNEMIGRGKVRKLFNVGSKKKEKNV